MGRAPFSQKVLGAGSFLASSAFPCLPAIPRLIGASLQLRPASPWVFTLSFPCACLHSRFSFLNWEPPSP